MTASDPARVFTVEIMKRLSIALFSLLLGSCAVTNTGRGNPEIFRVGELEVWLYQDREKMTQDLPILLTLVDATRVADRQVKVLGYYDKEKKRIYAIDDARILLHEFKHYLEPDWRHAAGTGHLKGSERQTEQNSPGHEVSPAKEPLQPQLVVDFWDEEEVEIVAHDAIIQREPQTEESSEILPLKNPQ